MFYTLYRKMRVIVYIWFLLTAAKRNVDCTLDIMVSGKEMQKLIFGGKNIKIVENGTVSSIVRDNGLAKMLPPILPKYSELMFNIASAKRLYYRMVLRSSDTTIMSTPTVTIPYKGQLQEDWITFKIRFPCTKLKSGTVKLEIVLDFFYDEKHSDFYKSINLSMRRDCKAAKKPTMPLPRSHQTPPECRKHCDIKNLKRKMCISDFVARVKITKAMLNENEKEHYYLAHIPRKRIFKRPVSFSMHKKNQVIKAFGGAVTCDCKTMEEGKKYLLFGREDSFNKIVYVDNYSIAFEINRHNKFVSNIVKRFKREYRTIQCPPALTRYTYQNNVIKKK